MMTTSISYGVGLGTQWIGWALPRQWGVSLWRMGQDALAAASRYHRTKAQMVAEHQIVLKCQQNPRYFAPLYERYYEAVFVYVNKRVAHEEATADITARVFLKCLSNIKNYTYQGVPFASWLFKIALNEINQFFRGQKKSQRVVSLTDYHVNMLMDEIDTEGPLIDPGVLVSALLEQLTPQEVQYLELRFFEGRSFKEVGYMLGVSEVNAKVKTYRILKKLKRIASEVRYH